MTVYVDDAGIRATVRDDRTGRVHTSTWCHLFTDQNDQTELHTLAGRIGLQRRWFQAKDPRTPWFWHYDVTAGKRRQAVAAGAVEITWREAARLSMARARAEQPGDPRHAGPGCSPSGVTRESV